MKREDVQDFLAMVQAAYPNYKPENKTATINVWLMALEEYDKNQIGLALKAYITSDTSGFAPAPGQIIDKIQMMTEPEELNELEAWALVSKALRNGSYNAEQEFENLPPLVQKVVVTPSQLRYWSQTDDESVESVIQSNFIKTYRQEVAKSREMRKIPQETRSALEQSQNMMIEG